MDQPDQPQLRDLPADVWGVIDTFLAEEDRLALGQLNKAAHEDEALSKLRQGVGYAHGPTELAALVADPDITVIIVPGGTISQDYPGKTIVAYGPVAVAGGTVYARHPQASITAVTGGCAVASGSVQVTGVSGGMVFASGSAQVTGVTGGQIRVNGEQVTVSLDRAAAFNTAGQVAWVDEPTTLVVTHASGGRLSAGVIVSGPDGPLQRHES